ncbi:transposase, partial [Maridesulfovibrio bastinii]|uniref:transposase n=9 Tax=Maridesulfovibrio bastinii TaxID=47157 RepID=UPI0005532119
RLYKRRKETVERSFADAKELHGHRYARMRGLSKAQEQSLLCAACQNMKKIALILSARRIFSDIFKTIAFKESSVHCFASNLGFDRPNLNFSN